MDEFSSALDTKTEELILKISQKNLNKKTIITISHREKIINNSDEY